MHYTYWPQEIPNTKKFRINTDFRDKNSINTFLVHFERVIQLLNSVKLEQENLIDKLIFCINWKSTEFWGFLYCVWGCCSKMSVLRIKMSYLKDIKWKYASSQTHINGLRNKMFSELGRKKVHKVVTALQNLSSYNGFSTRWQYWFCRIFKSLKTFWL